MNIIKAFDFFCGAGGLTRGLLDAGIDVVAGFDIDERCKETYELNNPHAKFFGEDIKAITVEKLKVLSKGTPFSDMLFAGCAPCQPFSQQRKGDNKTSDVTLLLDFGELIRKCKPGFVLAENVPGMAKVKGFSTFKRFLSILSECKYEYIYDTLDAKRYGVPQTRRRLVLIAALNTIPTLPQPKYGPGLLPYKTVHKSISHFPAIDAGQNHAETPNHVAAAITDVNINRLKHTPHNGGDRRNWPKPLWLKCHKGDYGGHTDVYGRMFWESPAPTLTGKCTSISNGRYGHPEQDRAISLREAAALQSFPDGYEFKGLKTHISLQIGNAVPVRLAEELGKHILFLRGK